MSSPCRAVRAAIVVILGALCQQCGTPPEPGTPGASDAPRPSGPGRQPDRAPRPRWARFAESRSWPAAASAFRSVGHAPPRYQITPRLPDRLRTQYESLVAGATLPDGFIVTGWHTEASTGAPGPVYVMEKRAGAWSFLVVDHTGRIEPVERIELCARCHAEAPSDGLFGPPRIAASPADGGSGAPAPE